jgi:hypothetical protein
VKESIEITKKQRNFLLYYKKRYIDDFVFLMQAQKGKGQLLSRSSMRSIAEKLYILLYLLQKDPSKDLYNFSYKAIKAGIDLKSVLVKADMKLLHEFIDFMLDKEREPQTMHQSLYQFLNLVRNYYAVIDKAYAAYRLEMESQEAKEQEKREDESEIVLNLFEENRGKEFHLLNYYKEIPVVCKSTLIELGEDFARFDISRCKYDIFAQTSSVYIKIPGFPKSIRSTIAKYEMYDFIEVREFLFEDLPQEQRKSVRVQPEVPIDVSLETEDSEYKGIVVDISAGGLGVILENCEGMEPEQVVKVMFKLKGEPVETKGSVRYVLKEQKKVGIEFEENVEVENRVLEYVLERQFAIIKELRL